MAIRTRHHHRRHHLRGFGYFSRLGPGLITGASDDDPSGIGTYSQVGAAFQFDLLWTALFTLPLAAAVQETAGRLGLATGRGLASLIKERFPRWVLILAVALVAVANVFNIGVDLGAMAAAVRLVFPALPSTLLIVAITATLLMLEVTVRYHRYSRVLRWLTLSLAAYIVVLLVVQVDWAEVLRSTFVPSLTWSRAEVTALIAIFGTTISPYLFFWQAGEEVEEIEDADDRAAHERLEHAAVVDRRHLDAMRADVFSGMASAVVVMWAIMVSTGATLGAHDVTTVQTADQAARALRPIAGGVAGLLFALGIVGTGALAVPVLAGSVGYALSEATGRREGLGKSPRQAPTFYAIIGAAMFIGLALNFSGVNPVRALYFAAVLNGLAAPPLILLMLLLSNSRATVGEWTGGRLSNALVGSTFLLMAGLPVAYLLAR